MNEAQQYTSVTGLILRRWGVVVTASIVAMVAGYLVSLTLPKQYAATATVLTAQSSSGVVADRSSKEQLALTLADVGRRPSVLEPAARTLGLTGWKQLRAAITIRLVPQTLLLEIKATATSPDEAANRADVVAASLVEVSSELSTLQQRQTEPGRADPSPVAPNVAFNTLIAGGVGFIGISGVLLLDEQRKRRSAQRFATVAPVLDRLQRTLHAPEDLPEALSGAGGPITSRSTATEWLDAITPVFLAVGRIGVSERSDRPLRIAVLSWHEHALRSSISTALASAFALEGRRTMLVDLDLRSPSIQHCAGSRLSPGVAELLDGDLLEPASTRLDHLQVVPAGRSAVRSTVLLGIRAMTATTEAIGNAAEVVVYDLPVQKANAEFALVRSHVDAIVFVVDDSLRHRADVGFLAQLKIAGIELDGLVITHPQQRPAIATEPMLEIVDRDADVIIERPVRRTSSGQERLPLESTALAVDRATTRAAAASAAHGGPGIAKRDKPSDATRIGPRRPGGAPPARSTGTR